MIANPDFNLTLLVYLFCLKSYCQSAKKVPGPTGPGTKLNATKAVAYLIFHEFRR
jgi:hypothetical protein